MGEYPEVMTAEQAAEYLQITVRTLYKLIDSKQLPAAKVGRVWRFRKADIDTFLENQVEANKAE